MIDLIFSVIRGVLSLAGYDVRISQGQFADEGYVMLIRPKSRSNHDANLRILFLREKPRGD